MQTKRRPSDYLAFVGLIILAIVVIWGLLHAAGLLAPWLTSLFPSSAPKIQVTAPASVTSEQEFKLTWKYSPSSQGMYVFLYQCTDSVVFETEAAGGGKIKIPCGAAFTVADGKSITLTPHLKGGTEQKVPLSIQFIPSLSNTERVSGSAAVTVQPQKQAEAKSSAKPAEKPAAATPTNPAQPKGSADLSVQITSMTLDTATGIGAVSFDITNVGSSASSAYYFIAQLPTLSGYLYTSPAQTPLQPGDHIINTLHFEQAVPGIVSISVDPSGILTESSRQNNYANGTLGAPSASPYYPYPH